MAEWSGLTSSTASQHFIFILMVSLIYFFIMSQILCLHLQGDLAKKKIYPTLW